MRLVAAWAVAAVCVLPALAQDEPTEEVFYQTVTQPVSHSQCPDISDDSCQTFEQQVAIMNNTGYQPGGPVVVVLTGASSLAANHAAVSFFVSACHALDAACVIVEHRFYGMSVPEAPAFTDEKLAQLTIHEALLDIDAVIHQLQSTQFPDGTHFAVVGAGFGASLASWYIESRGWSSHLVAGVASSAALEAQTDFYGYFEHFPAAVQGVTNLPQSDPQDGTRCLHFLQNGTVELGLRVDNSGSDAVEVATLFNACQSTIEPEDAFFFKWVVAEVIASSMEVNTPSAWSVNDTCAAAQIDGYTSAAALDDGISYLSAPAVDTMAAVQRAFQFNLDLQFQLCLHSCEGESDTALMREVLFRPLQGENGCVSFDEAEWITSMRNTSNPLRAWWWQRCTQLGWFHGSDDTTASQGVLFPGDLPVANVVDYCQRIFDATIASTPNVTGTNLHLGGVSAYSVKTAASSGNSSDNLQPVLFTNADMDPFAALAPNSASSARGIEVIDYVGGHNSLGFVTLESESDPPSLTSARHSVVVYMVDAFAAVGVGPGASTGSAGDDSIAVAGVIFMASLLALLILIAAVGATVSRARHKIVRTGVSTSTEGAPESGGGGGSEEVKVSVD